jgi:hypothetical protein
MRETTHPEGIKEVNAVEITTAISDFIIATAHDIEAEAGNRSKWEQKIDILIDLRYGYRAERTNPWPGCANYSLPLIDAHINKAKPSYINLALGVTPICTFEPFGSEDMEPAKKRELLFDWRMRTKVRFVEPYCIGVDKALEQGSVVFKTVWNYTTRSYQEELDLDDLDEKALNVIMDERTTDDILAQIIAEELAVDIDFEENIEEINKAIEKFRQGETKFKFNFLEVEHNEPEVTACSVRSDIVVPIDTTDIQYARFIDQPFWRTTTRLKKDMRDEKYKEYPDEDINGWGSKETNKTASSRQQDEVILLHETCCWYDINDDDIKERCIATWPDNDPSSVLRFIEVPYEHGLFPYEQVRRELNDPGFYTPRGIPALDEDYQKGISEAVNQAENNGTIVNKPVIVMRRNTVTNIKNRRYIPGETVETNTDPNDYQIRQMVNISQPILFQLAQYLKSWADDRIGNVTAGLSELNNLPGAGPGGKKTKAEIDLVSSLQGEVQSLDLIVWQQQMARVYYQIDALYNQYGDEEEEVIITGQKPQKISRRETQGKWNIVPNGRLDNTNPALRANKAFNLMKIFIGDPDINQYELKKLFLTDYDSRIANKILYSEDDKQRIQAQQMQMMEVMKKKALQEGVDMKQIEILLEVQRETMLAPITGKKYAPD